MLVVREGRYHCLLTEADVLRDFANLRKAKSSLADGVLSASNCVGSRCSAYYHWPDMIRASASKPSAQRVLERINEGRWDPSGAVRRLGSLTKAVYLNSALQSVTNFRALAARDVALAVGAKRCLDFCGGWGNRLVGFLAAGAEVVELVEPRASACEAYRRQHALLGGDARLTVHQGAAEDVLPTLEGPYDLVMTSPPYMSLEIYDDGPQQVSQRYGDAESYVEGFLVPCCLRALELLAPEGLLVVNVADNARRGVVFCARFLREMRARVAFVGTLLYETRCNPAHQRGPKGEPCYVFARSPAAGWRAALWTCPPAGAAARSGAPRCAGARCRAASDSGSCTRRARRRGAGAWPPPGAA
jgi:hypothetical protein